MVFVGYGNVLLKDSIDDYNGADVKGKTAIMAMGGPKGVRSSLFYDPFTKVTNAIRNGATGVVLFYPGRLLQKLAFNNVHGFLSEDILSFKDTSITGAMTDMDIDYAIYSKRKLVKKCLKQNKMSLSKEIRKAKKGVQVQKELTSMINCSYDVVFKEQDCKNVVGVLQGSDAVLKHEYVVLTAHLDHLGIGNQLKVTPFIMACGITPQVRQQFLALQKHLQNCQQNQSGLWYLFV